MSFYRRDTMYEMTNELYHFGIKGQKWGIRRYQNFDGSYTQAGMKRYNKSKEKYDKSKARYDAAKKSGDKTELTNARLQLKKDERQLKKDYAHLKQDKMADKGKELYSKGKTITGNGATTRALETIGSVSMAVLAAQLTGQLRPENYGMLTSTKQTINKALLVIGGTSLAAAGIKNAVDKNQNAKLRAYYSHTSNY